MAFQGWPPRPSFQQGYFTYLPDCSPQSPPPSSTASQGTATIDPSCTLPQRTVPPQRNATLAASNGVIDSGPTSSPTYSYYVRMINPKKKTDFLVRMWHDERAQFKSPAELKLKLIDSFANEVSTTGNFHVGYFEPPGNSNKRWIVEKRDLSTIYSVFEPGSKVNLWCERKVSEDDENENLEPRKKKKKVADKEHVQEDLDEIFHDLKEKHPKMEGPKLRLWAKLIQTGRHESYENPPPIPLITGGTNVSKPKKESLSEAVAGAASAIAKVLQPNSAGPAHNQTVSDDTKISPMKVASLRRSCLEDLKKLKDLLEDVVFLVKLNLTTKNNKFCAH